MATVLATLLIGCSLPAQDWAAPDGRSPGNGAERTIPDADTGWTAASGARAELPAELRPAQVAFELLVVHIQVPSASAGSVQNIWNHVREDVVPGETQLRLRRNGFRLGIGHVDFWEPIKAAIEVIDGHRVTLSQPVRVPPGFPLALELDEEPHDQTLFFVGADGILSGSTWPQSRNVLRVTYAADPEDPERAWLFMAPEVRQRREGLRFIRNESGLWQVPKQNVRAFDAAAATLTLAPGEFLLVAPSEQARLYGLLGGAFLTSEIDGTRYDSYVFLRPEVKRVDRHQQ